LKLHILAIAVHPDDVELSCAGTLIKHIIMGQTVGILDLTRGELGTRGTPELRIKEANDAAKIMGVHVRVNAGMADGFFRNDEAHQRRIIAYLRHFQPDIVIANSLEDRHPDHGRAGRLIADSCFYSGLMKIETEWESKAQQAWRPRRVYHMVQDRQVQPTFAVDISSVHAQKMAAIRCFSSQFHSPDSDEPLTYIATQDFMHNIEHRDALVGKRIGVQYAEPFVSENLPGIGNLDDILLPELP